MLELLKINQLVQIKPFREEWKGDYQSRVEDIQGDSLVLAIPYINGGLLPLREGDRVTVVFWNRTALYSFEAKILDVAQEPLPIFKLTIPEKVLRIQRRQFVRVHVNLPLLYREKEQDEFTAVTTVDVSSGGAKFIAKRAMAEGSQIEVIINFTDFKVETTAEVLRVSEGRSNQFYISIRFKDMEQKMVDRILSWCFKYQLALRRRGLL